MLSDGRILELRRQLLVWFKDFQRDLPWRRTRDPYSIWVSETMLQQTRVAAALPYYERFLSRFPDFRTLASAPESEVLAAWAGLGYYYRARNLQKAAQEIAAGGSFPSSYENLRALPGVGDYTAAAVASIAFDLPHAVLDGNVFRALSRVFADSTDISSGKGRKHFAALAASLLDHEQPGAFNQAVMELGATVCLVRNPQCLLCPIADHCRARQEGTQDCYPVNNAKQLSVKQDRSVFWIEKEGAVLAWQRPDSSRLMPGFWELPEASQLPAAVAGSELGLVRHGITIHSYTFHIFDAPVPTDLGVCQWLTLSCLETIPISTVFRKVLQALHKRRNTAKL